MQSYINHLIEDITQAERSQELYTRDNFGQPKTLEEEFAEIERWLEQGPAHTFGYYCGLEQEQFPPAEKLTEKQLKQVIKSFSHLLFTWNLNADIPANVPLNKKYALLISILGEKTDIVSIGFLTFDFCNYDPPSCPFEEHCICKDFEDYTNDIMSDDLPDEALPF